MRMTYRSRYKIVPASRLVGRTLAIFAFSSLAIFVFVAFATGAARAGLAAITASADIDVSVRKAPGRAAVEGVPFQINVGIGNAGPDASTVHLFLDLPEGVSATRGNALGCPAGSGTLDCGAQTLPAADQSDAFSTLVAARAGSYTITARATDPSVPDPNSANNVSSLVIAVAQVSPAVTDFRITPRAPRAGARVRVSFGVVDSVSGASLQPRAVTCTALAGAMKIRGKGSVAVGRATCTFLPPTSAKGRTLRGSVSATASGKQVRKSFSVRLR